MQNEPPITQADRELLAEVYKADGSKARVESILNDEEGDLWYHDRQALYAIAKARQLGRKQGLREAAEVCNSYAVCAHDGDIFDPDYADGEYNAAVSCEEKILALIDKPEGAV